MASAASSPLRKTATLFSRQKKAFLVTAVAPQTRVELSSQRASSPSSVQTSVLFCAQPCFLINGQRLLHSSPIARLTGKESSGDDPGTKQETDQNKSNKGLGAEPLESGDTIQVNPSQPVKVYSLKDMQQKQLAVIHNPLRQASKQTHYDRNFITAVRAMTDFVLRPEHLKGLRETTRRSPNEVDPPLTVYWRKDVEAKSLEIWGSREALDKEKERRRTQDSKGEEYSSFLQKFMANRRKKRKLTRENWPVRPRSINSSSDPQGLESSSAKVVLSAVAINTMNFTAKIAAWGFTGSHAMFSEAIHSLADTLNQLILVYGINQSIKGPTESHPYGYNNMQYVSSLISGVGIFCLGAGVSVYHGVSGLAHPHEMESLGIAFAVLGGSFLSESITLVLAVKSIRESALEKDMSFFEYVYGGYDPSVNVVLLEDMAAVMGVVIAAGAMGLSVHTGSHIPDALGSVVIGGLLGSVASFMIFSNTTALVGRSIPGEKLMLLNKELEGDIMVRQVHDVKGIDMGNGVIRYKAEVDVDGRELAKYYLQKNNMPLLLKDVQQIQDEAELELFLLKHGENIVDCLGEQVDRIEKHLKQMHPEVKHVDLEVL